MSSKINFNTRILLEHAYISAGVNNQKLNDYEAKSPTLVTMLNNYKGSYVYDAPKTGAYYSSKDKSISIAQGYKGTNFDLALAHELGHATGQYQSLGFTDNEIQKKKAAMTL